MAFWDSSALAPLFVEQASTSAAERLSLQFDIAVSWGTTTEIHSAMARMRRPREIDQTTLDYATRRLRTADKVWKQIRPQKRLREKAQLLLYQYPLRAADSLQLAAAYVWSQGRPSGGTFICADFRLASAAENEGFTVVRP